MVNTRSIDKNNKCNKTKTPCADTERNKKSDKKKAKTISVKTKKSNVTKQKTTNIETSKSRKNYRVTAKITSAEKCLKNSEKNYESFDKENFKKEEKFKGINYGKLKKAERKNDEWLQ